MPISFKAPCGCEGTPIIGTYVRCNHGCDDAPKVKAERSIDRPVEIPQSELQALVSEAWNLPPLTALTNAPKQSFSNFYGARVQELLSQMHKAQLDALVSPFPIIPIPKPKLRTDEELSWRYWATPYGYGSSTKR